MRLIDAEALRDALYEADAITMKGVAIINQFPIVEAKPIVHAHWEGDTCSYCKLRWKENMCDDADDWGYFDPMPDYCCNCGALMDEPILQTHENGVKIPVISMEDVPKIMEE